MRLTQIGWGLRARGILGLFLLGIVATPQAASSAGSWIGCEPAGPLELSARVLDKSSQGATARVVIELAARSQRPLRLLKVRPTLVGRHASDAAARLPERTLELDIRKTARYELELAGGREHHLLFFVRSEEEGETVQQSSVYVRVNLDPQLEPAVQDGVLQYRARMGARAEQ